MARCSTRAAVLARRAVALTAPPAPALAPAHAVAFAHRGGYATLVGATDPRVHAWRRGAGAACVSPAPARGALLCLASDADVAALAAREGGYKLVAVPVTAADGGGGETTTALTFVSRAGLSMIAGPAPPRAAYAARVRAGAAAVNLDAEWRAWLEGVPTLPDGGPLPAGYTDTGAGRAAAAAAAAALVGVGVVAAVGGQ